MPSIVDKKGSLFYDTTNTSPYYYIIDIIDVNTNLPIIGVKTVCYVDGIETTLITDNEGRVKFFGLPRGEAWLSISSERYMNVSYRVSLGIGNFSFVKDTFIEGYRFAHTKIFLSNTQSEIYGKVYADSDPLSPGYELFDPLQQLAPSNQISLVRQETSILNKYIIHNPTNKIGNVEWKPTEIAHLSDSSSYKIAIYTFPDTLSYLLYGPSFGIQFTNSSGISYLLDSVYNINLADNMLKNVDIYFSKQL